MKQKDDLLNNLMYRFILFVWSGFTVVKSNKIILGVYFILFFLATASYSQDGETNGWFLVIFIVALTIAVYNHIKKAPLRKRRKYFFSVFNEMKFHAKDNTVPTYLYEEKSSLYATTFTFQSVIPLAEWKKIKETLEMYINKKIVDIIQDSENYRLIHVIVQTGGLPDRIEWHDNYIDSIRNRLYIGTGYHGLVYHDLERNPHSFIAGETGSGKSNILKCLIHQSILKEYDVILIDFKRGVSFSSFRDVVDIYYEYPSTIKILEEMVEETKRRLDLFRENRVDNLNDYNRSIVSYLPRTIIFVDELAELLKVRDKAISNSLYDSIETLTRLSRAVGIHLIMGIQRPDSTIVNGQIKNNVSFRICGRFVDDEPSRIMLHSDLASKLPNIKGRFIIKDNSLQEIQCFYFNDNYTYIKNEEVAIQQPIEREEEANLEMPTEIQEEQEITPETKTPNEFEFDFDFSDI